MKSRFRQPRIRPPECNPALVLLEPHRDEFCRKREEQDDRLNKPRRNEDGDSGCSATGERISDQLSAGTLQCFQGLGKFTLSNSVGRPVLSAVVCLLVIDWHRFGRWGSDLSPADPMFASTCSCDCDSPDSPLYAVCVRIAVCPNRCRSLGRVPRTRPSCFQLECHSPVEGLAGSCGRRLRRRETRHPSLLLQRYVGLWCNRPGCAAACFGKSSRALSPSTYPSRAGDVLRRGELVGPPRKKRSDLRVARF